MKICLLFFLVLASISRCTQSGSYHFNLNEELFRKGERIATVTVPELKEASGLEASPLNPGLFWVIADSGNDPAVFLIDKNGRLSLTVRLNGVKNRDWEDISILTNDTGSFLLVGDIGDNLGRRKRLSIHRFPEPKFDGEREVVLEKEAIETMNFTYTNGARDAETLLNDPQTGELIIVTKREENCLVYSFPFKRSKKRIKISPSGQLSLTGLTAGDANSHGEILMKSYEEIFYWSASDKPVVERILNGPDYRIPYEHEPQGEAICWDGDKNFFTISEFHPFSAQYLYFYKRSN